MDKKPSELDIISTFLEVLGQPKQGYSRIGDDVAYITNRGRMLIVKCDMLVGLTDIPRGMTLRQAARKAVAACISDFTAKGVRPMAALVSLGIPQHLSSEDIRDLALGVKDAREEFGFEFLGGDTNQAQDLILDCILIGCADSIIGRKGCKPGDIVAVSGPFGYTGAGLHILSKGLVVDGEFAKKAVDSVLNPKPPLELGLRLAYSKLMTSSIDSSDGLAISLYSLAEAGGVKVVVEESPAAGGLEEFAEIHGLSCEELVFYAGEEYEVVFTTREEYLGKVKRIAKRLGREVRVIGRVEKGGAVVEYAPPSGERRVLERRGWVHLQQKG